MTGSMSSSGYLAEWRWGWRAIAASMMGMATGVNLQYYVASIFIQHYTNEFGWTRGQIANSSAALFIAGFCAPLIGAAMDRLGARIVFAVGLAAYCLACVGMANLHGSIVEFYIIYFVMVSFGMGTGVLMWSRVINGSFDKARGLALSVGMASITFSAMVMPPLLQSVIAAYGWRAGWLTIGAVSLAFGLATLAVMPGRASQGKAQRFSLTETRRVMRQKDFWLAVFGMFIINIPSGGILNQMAAVIADSGIDAASVAMIMSAFALSVFLGRFITGIGLDRLPPHWVSFTAFSMPAIGCLTLAAATSTTAYLVAIGVVLAGLSQGSEGDIGPFVIARRFGMEAFGTMMGGIVLATSFGVSLGSMIFGAIYDATGAYEMAYYLGAACFLAGGLAYFNIRSSPSPAAAEVAPA